MKNIKEMTTTEANAIENAVEAIAVEVTADEVTTAEVTTAEEVEFIDRPTAIAKALKGKTCIDLLDDAKRTFVYHTEEGEEKSGKLNFSNAFSVDEKASYDAEHKSLQNSMRDYAFALKKNDEEVRIKARQAANNAIDKIATLAGFKAAGCKAYKNRKYNADWILTQSGKVSKKSGILDVKNLTSILQSMFTVYLTNGDLKTAREHAENVKASLAKKKANEKKSV